VVISANPLQSNITAPIHTWTPSIAPSGLAFITSNSFKKWKGNLLVGALAYRYLARCVIENNKVVSETKMFNNEGRVRNVKQGPDGAIYVSIESPGRIIRITAN
jgi:glucose/arabinose dehydrogenase